MALSDVKNESFTQRFLRRAFTTVNDSYVSQFTCSRRKLNILQAINNGSCDVTATTNVVLQERKVTPEAMVKRYGTKSGNWKRYSKCDDNSTMSREIYANAAIRANRKDFELQDNDWKYYNNNNSVSRAVDTSRAQNVKCKNVETQRKLQEQLVCLDSVEKFEQVEGRVSSHQQLLSTRRNDEEASLAGDTSQIVRDERSDERKNSATYRAPYASLNEAIKDLERDIDKLHLRAENSAFACERRYNCFAKRHEEKCKSKYKSPECRDTVTANEKIEMRHDSEVISEVPLKSVATNDVHVVRSSDGRFDASKETKTNDDAYDDERLEKDISPTRQQQQQAFSCRYKKHTPPIPASKPKRSKKSMLPNMESTRRSSIGEATKKNTSPSSIQSSISTITVYNSPKLPLNNSETGYHAEIEENSVPYEVEKFLENALGDELFNVSSTINTTSNPLELGMCQTTDTPIREKTRNLKLPASDPPLQTMGTFNRTMVFYRSLSQRIKKKLRPRLKEKTRRDHTLLVSMPISKRNDKVQSLLQQLEIQQTLIHQASKALNLCHANRKFVGSTQHVESERLLLLTSLKKKAVLEELKQIGASDDNAPTTLTEKGQINIANVTLNVKEDAYLHEGYLEETSEWFVVVVSHGSTVWATTALDYSPKSSKIRFPGFISLPDLTPNFKIAVNVYSLKLRDFYCDKDGKYQAANSTGKCPSPKSLWKRVEKGQTLKYQLECSSVKETSFKLCGQVELMLHDLSLPSPWPLMGVPLNSVLQGTIDLDLTCRLHISVTHAGFLTHGEECGGYALWNRRWCVLEGHVLKFWNYPQEREWKPPLLSIDLSCCTSNEVMLVDRTICAKPRTLVFKTTRKRRPQDQDSLLLECWPSYTVVRNLLSCDSVNDLLTWSSKLNYVLSVLRDWNTTTHTEALITEL